MALLLLGAGVLMLIGCQLVDRIHLPRRPRPKGPLRTVRGIARGPHRPSPFEGVPCLFTWVRLEVSVANHGYNPCELAAGHDFLLESAEGVVPVRIDGLRLLGHPGLAPGGMVTTVPPGPLGDLVRSVSRAMTWSEFHVRDGDELEVTGICRDEPALETSAAFGLRDNPQMPTLTGAGARLDVRFLR